MKSVKYFNSRTPKNDFLTTSTWTYEIKSKFRKYTCSLHWLILHFLYASSVQRSKLNLCLFSLKNSRLCRDLNPEPPRYQADMLPTEQSWLWLLGEVGWQRCAELLTTKIFNKIHQANFTLLLWWKKCVKLPKNYPVVSSQS